ncbi:N-alpha-acetyltransferase 35 NatC auxiliary subunit, partial [Nowakowskiella sp. JEL0078]
MPLFKDISGLLNRAVEGNSNIVILLFANYFHLPDLNVGDLVLSPSFSLFDSMSAIEIMEKKMDTGMSLPKSKNKLSIADLSSKTYLASELIGIIDEIQALELTWLNGHLLSQTIFTCIYFHKPSEIQNPILRFYVLAVLKCTHLSRKEIMRASVFEDEDFCPDTFGFNLYEEEKEKDILKGLQQVENSLFHHLKNIREKIHGNIEKGSDEVFELSKGLQFPEERESEYAEALLFRISFRKAYLSTLGYFSKNNYELALKNAKQAENLISKIKNTMSLSEYCERDLIMESFDQDMNRKLFTQIPPRPINILSPEEGFVAINSVVRSFVDIANLVTITLSPNEIHAALFNSEKNKILGTVSLNTFARQLLEKFSRPPYFTSKVAEVRKTVMAFVEKSELCVYASIEMFCRNRPRQRAFISRLIMDWEILQNE